MNFIVNLLIILPARIASYFAWAGPLVMRLVVGYVFMLTGWGKLNNLPQMIQNFTEWGIPFPYSHPLCLRRGILRRHPADPRPVHPDSGGDAGRGHAGRDQGGEMGNRPIAGDLLTSRK